MLVPCLAFVGVCTVVWIVLNLCALVFFICFVVNVEAWRAVWGPLPVHTPDVFSRGESGCGGSLAVVVGVVGYVLGLSMAASLGVVYQKLVFRDRRVCGKRTEESPLLC